MAYYIAKVAITAVLVVLISEISKRSSFIGAVLAILWLYIDTGDAGRVIELAGSVFWLVLPSLALFIALPVLLANEVNFYLSLAVSIAITAICYWLMIVVLRHFGVEL